MYPYGHSFLIDLVSTGPEGTSMHPMKHRFHRSDTKLPRSFFKKWGSGGKERNRKPGRETFIIRDITHIVARDSGDRSGERMSARTI